MKENKVKIMIYLSLMIVFVVLAFFVMFLMNKPENPNDVHEPITDNYIFSDIYDRNEYQTIYSSIRNYFQAINENQDAAFHLVWEEYKKSNNVTINNISNYVEKKYDNFGYKINDIKKYYNPYYSIYFIKGEYSWEALDDVIEKTYVEDVMIEDNINNTYAVLPILNKKDSFETILNKYELTNYNKEISKNNYNEVRNSTMGDFQEVTMYFNESINKIINDCNEAYTNIGTETKKEYPNANEFKKLCDQYKEEFVSPTIKNYKIEYKDGKKNIAITDNYSIKYNFIIESVKNYSIDIIK